MKKITALLTALMMCMTFGADFVYAADSNSARNAVLQIRKEIDSHKVSIQSKNSELFKLAPEEIAEADFKDYDTSSVLLGTDLYKFSAGSVSNGIKGKDGTINTLAPNEYKIHSTIKYGNGDKNFRRKTGNACCGLFGRCAVISDCEEC